MGREEVDRTFHCGRPVGQELVIDTTYPSTILVSLCLGCFFVLTSRSFIATDKSEGRD